MDFHILPTKLKHFRDTWQKYKMQTLVTHIKVNTSIRYKSQLPHSLAASNPIHHLHNDLSLVLFHFNRCSFVTFAKKKERIKRLMRLIYQLNDVCIVLCLFFFFSVTYLIEMYISDTGRQNTNVLLIQVEIMQVK